MKPVMTASKFFSS